MGEGGAPWAHGSSDTKSGLAVSEVHGVHGGAYARQGRGVLDCESDDLAGRASRPNLSDIKSNSHFYSRGARSTISEK